MAELLFLWMRGVRPAEVRPQSLARLLSEASGDEDVEALRLSLLRLLPPRGGVRLSFQMAAPFWRLSSASPAGALECGGALPCFLRVALPQGYPIVPPTSHHGSVEVLSPGALGREAARVLSRAAQEKVSEVCHATPAGGAAEHLVALVEWLENTELLEFAANSCQLVAPSGTPSCQVRAFVRFHHVQSIMKLSYLRLWAEDLGIAAVLAAGQPGMLLAEGPRGAIQAYLHRATKILHWGPTPARLVASAVVEEGGGAALRPGLVEASEDFPAVVTAGGTYNGRDSIDFAGLAHALARAGHVGAASELRALLPSAFAHARGRVKESADGWLGYASSAPEPALAGELPEGTAAAATGGDESPTRQPGGGSSAREGSAREGCAQEGGGHVRAGRSGRGETRGRGQRGRWAGSRPQDGTSGWSQSWYPPPRDGHCHDKPW